MNEQVKTGFTVTCNNCGNSAIFNEHFDDRYKDDGIYISGDTMFEAGIQCKKCGELVSEI